MLAVPRDRNKLASPFTRTANFGRFTSTGTLTMLEPLAANRTMFSFDERYNLEKAPFKWFEGPIYKFINKNNEDSMRRASAWLGAHPEYRADLIAS